MSGRPAHTTLVSLIGVEAALVEDILDDTRRAYGRRDRLVYLTDAASFVPFRRQGAIFEYMPPLAEQAAFGADMPWRSYLGERWQLLLAKWAPHRILAFGMTMEAFLAAAPPGRAERSGGGRGDANDPMARLFRAGVGGKEHR